MSKKVESGRMGKFVKALLVLNLLLWIYFWIAFAHASYPFRPDPLGHPAGTGYTFWGHSIGVVESGSVYPFFRVMLYAEFPSFTLATLVVRLFSPHQLINGFFAGISGGGWLLLAVMLLSFVQWSLVGWLAGRGRPSFAGTGGPLKPGFGLSGAVRRLDRVFPPLVRVFAPSIPTRSIRVPYCRFTSQQQVPLLRRPSPSR